MHLLSEQHMASLLNGGKLRLQYPVVSACSHLSRLEMEPQFEDLVCLTVDFPHVVSTVSVYCLSIFQKHGVFFVLFE